MQTRRLLAAVTVSSLWCLSPLGALPASAANAPSAPPRVERLAGADRFATAAAAALATNQAGRVPAVYLARADDVADALAAGILRDGPVLPVPRCGPVPAVISETVGRLSPAQVLAVGGPAAVCDQVLADVAQRAGRAATGRVAGVDRYETAVAISKRVFATIPARRVYVTAAVTDALVAGIIDDGPVLVVPPDGPLPSSVRAELDRLGPDVIVTAVGGPAAIADTRLAAIAAGRRSERVAGADRIATAAALNSLAAAQPTGRVVLAAADRPTDILAGAEFGGPLLLVGNCGDLPAVAADAIRAHGPERLVVVGGPFAICDSLVTQALAQAPTYLNELSAVAGTVDHDTGPADGAGTCFWRSLSRSITTGDPLDVTFAVVTTGQLRLRAELAIAAAAPDTARTVSVEVRGPAESITSTVVSYGQVIPLDVDVSGLDRVRIVARGDTASAVPVTLGNARLLPGSGDAPANRAGTESCDTLGADANLAHLTPAASSGVLHRGPREAAGQRFSSAVWFVTGATPSTSSADWALGRDWHLLNTTVALADTTTGSATVRFIADGALLAERTVTPGVAVPVDLSELRGRLRLRVEITTAAGTGPASVVLGDPTLRRPIAV